MEAHAAIVYQYTHPSGRRKKTPPPSPPTTTASRADCFFPLVFSFHCCFNTQYSKELIKKKKSHISVVPKKRQDMPVVNILLIVV